MTRFRNDQANSSENRVFFRRHLKLRIQVKNKLSTSEHGQPITISMHRMSHILLARRME